MSDLKIDMGRIRVSRHSPDTLPHVNPPVRGDTLAVSFPAASALREPMGPEQIAALFQGAGRLGASFRLAPDFVQFVKDLRVGDVVVTKGEGLVKALSLGKPWTHAAICVEVGPPPRFVEALGVTGSPENRGKVREADLWDFLAENQSRLGHTVAIIRPAASPAIVAAAVRIARGHVGQRYDYSFSKDLPPELPNLGGAYCSKLVQQVYVAADRGARRQDRSLSGPTGLRAGARTIFAQTLHLFSTLPGYLFNLPSSGAAGLVWYMSAKNALTPDGGIVRPTDLVDFNLDKVVGAYRLLDVDPRF